MPERWSETHEPAANTQATIAHAAEAQRYHVIDGFTASIGGTSASSEVDLTIKDGSTVVYSTGMLSAANALDRLQENDLGIQISVNTAATIEFDAAGGANTTERVTMWGHSEDIF